MAPMASADFFVKESDTTGGSSSSFLVDWMADQAGRPPVVEAVYDWSSFGERAIWGVLTSLWASHFVALWPAHDDQGPLARMLDDFYAGDDVVAEMRPVITAVESGRRVHLHVRRASCCRFYLVPAGGLCASCPLGSDAEGSAPVAT